MYIHLLCVICVSIFICIRTCVCLSICIHIHVHTHVYVHICIYIHFFIYIYMLKLNLNLCIGICTYEYMYMYIYIYIYIYTHIYTYWCIYLDALKILIAQGLAALLRDLTRSYRAWFVHMRNSTFIWDMTPTWLNTYRQGTSSAAWHGSLIWDVNMNSYGMWFVHIWHVSFIFHSTRSYVSCHVHSDIALTLLVHMGRDSLTCVMKRSYGTWLTWQKNSSSRGLQRYCVTWLVHMGHDLFVRDMSRTYWTCPFIYDMSHMTRSCGTFIHDMTHMSKYLSPGGSCRHMCVYIVKLLHKPCHTHAFVPSHVGTSHVTCVTYERVVSHTQKTCVKLLCPSHLAYNWVVLHVRESCHVRKNHVTYEWVISHTNEACHIPMSHVTYEWEIYVTHEYVISRMKESCHVRKSHVAYERVMSHRNKSCYTCERHGVKLLRPSHVTNELVMPHMNEPCHIWIVPKTCKWVVSHMKNSCLHMNESCHISTSHITCKHVLSHMNKSGHVWTSNITPTKDLRKVVAPEWKSRTNESRHILTSHIFMWTSHVT